MSSFFSLAALSDLTAVIAAAGCVQTVLGSTLLARFMRRSARVVPVHQPTPVTILKPLHGDEPLLEQALESFCTLDYPDYQVVFGVQSASDPAIAVIRRLQGRHPTRALDLVIDPTEHGTNRKIGNLMNMMRVARHDTLVISDSDIHVTPTYLDHVLHALEQPGVGLVTTLYAGLPASPSLVRELSACQINHNFLPGVMLSRYLGRQDCLGATMALRRDVLERVGGLRALVPHIADDAMLGRLVRALGLSIAIAPCMTWTTIGEPDLGALLAHELRWGRTVKTLEPLGYASSSIQLPLFWAGVTLACAPHAPWSVWFFAAIWLVRAACAFASDRLLGQRQLYPLLLLPLRDWLSAAIMVGSASGTRVAWRGRTMHLAPHTAVGARGHSIVPGD
ncbi:ceramide glucosyltransferase [Ameyamaea chiangmaiensis NBRC 103196]|uniref:Bacteriohopanetetrol glucosamine biosynthesis glycosyltransferase HpnI n=1 Tax=Ameyamaea chiangmaiensis TaxID=442969 RepID=A0A850PC58_9PROT|nr:bacteriohopanetetrol glucosamine biosynthesis glycosyltransferase HpnI [Ameyamaea chiangmaiensis]MBS4075901.1 bacteriohopanetetrol glucosamine biosynthesis glycosyltransferase HpnI [Ameyamaea chiangmaiensis]NVN41704.1 bacteriohopanetetrol glucosamine biosynthesis glycosyltransferase HpnI [Ameyamaea chiangmaiensis]GBQ70232.1 ceramide glucosyltransferase [Ameyamaea chiangmaiensis NBRC 103196]